MSGSDWGCGRCSTFFTFSSFPGRNLFIYFDLALLACLIAIAARRERLSGAWDWSQVRPARLNGTQWVLVIVSGVVFVVSLLSTANYLLRRRQGDWDAWMMYNRAARFIHFDQANWRESFSEQMHPIFHADYPLLLAGSIAAGWELVGGDSSAVPMIQSALFAVACVGLAAGALALVKSIGQAALAVAFLWGIPVFVNEGARQMADVPMAFYVLATGILLYLYVDRREVRPARAGWLDNGPGGMDQERGRGLRDRSGGSRPDRPRTTALMAPSCCALQRVLHCRWRSSCTSSSSWRLPAIS